MTVASGRGGVVVRLSWTEAAALKSLLVQARPAEQTPQAFEAWHNLSKVSQTLVLKLAVALGRAA